MGFRMLTKPIQFDIYLVDLDPSVGAEMQKTRPCIVVSPSSINNYLKTSLVAPLTSTVKSYPMRIPIKFNDREGAIALDQMRVASHLRFRKHLGKVDKTIQARVSETLIKMFEI